MKKYILSIPYIEYEEACLELFEKMSNQGYELTKVGLCFVFEKTNRKLKYQLDYTERDDEYNQIIKELGYIHLGACRTLHFYANEDLNATDLVNDSRLKKQLLLEKHPFSTIAFLLIFGIFLFALNIFNISTHFQFLAEVYLYLDHFFYYMLWLALALLCIGTGLDEYRKHRAIEKEDYIYKKHHRLDQLFTLFEISLLSVFIAFDLFINFKITISLFLLFSLLIYSFTYYLSWYTLQNVENKKRRNLLRITLALFYGIVISIFHSFTPPETKVPAEFPEDKIYLVKDNSFVHRIDYGSPIWDERFNIIGKNHYIEAKNNKIATSIFQYFVIKEDVYARYPTEEEQMAYADENFKNWSEDLLPIYDYQTVIQNMTKIETDLVDLCYYYHQTIIAIKDHLVLSVRIENASEITPTLNKLIAYFHQNSNF